MSTAMEWKKRAHEVTAAGGIAGVAESCPNCYRPFGRGPTWFGVLVCGCGEKQLRPGRELLAVHGLDAAIFQHLSGDDTPGARRD